MSAFQPPFLFSLHQLSHVAFMGHHNFDANALFYQNHCSMANMNSNDSNRINMNSLNASPWNFPMEIPKRSSFLQEIPRQNPSKQYSFGKWTDREEKLYNEFTEQYSLSSPTSERLYNDRKRRFYFNAMSSFIGTRSSDQCRSHDQKVRKKLGLGSRRTSPSSKKTSPSHCSEEEDNVMINSEANHHMDMIPSCGMTQQIPAMPIECSQGTSGYENVDCYFNFGPQEPQQSSEMNYDQGYHQNFRSAVMINSEFGRSYSSNDENFNLGSGW